MTTQTFLAIGECMIEMAVLENGDFRQGFAGDTLNTAWYVRACLPRESWTVSYFTRLGEDLYSAKMKSFLADNGIDTSHIVSDATRRPGLYLIDVKDGERSFTYWRDQSAAKLLADDEDRLQEALDAADMIYFSGITLAILSPERRQAFLAKIAAARNAGKMTVFDPNIRPRLWEDSEALKHYTMMAAASAEISLPSFDDEAALFGDSDLAACAERYRAAGCGLVVVKNGGGPMLAVDASGTKSFEGFEKVKPVDTTGAGDSFNGGFLAAWATGVGIEGAVHRAHNVSLQVIQHRGALMPMDRVK
jgi:2-dehydro-3-deoxygluconokinase